MAATGGGVSIIARQGIEGTRKKGLSSGKPAQHMCFDSNSPGVSENGTLLAIRKSDVNNYTAYERLPTALWRFAYFLAAQYSGRGVTRMCP